MNTISNKIDWDYFEINKENKIIIVDTENYGKNIMEMVSNLDNVDEKIILFLYTEHSSPVQIDGIHLLIDSGVKFKFIPSFCGYEDSLDLQLCTLSSYLLTKYPKREITIYSKDAGYDILINSIDFQGRLDRTISSEEYNEIKGDESNLDLYLYRKLKLVKNSHQMKELVARIKDINIEIYNKLTKMANNINKLIKVDRSKENTLGLAVVLLYGNTDSNKRVMLSNLLVNNKEERIRIILNNETLIKNI